MEKDTMMSKRWSEVKIGLLAAVVAGAQMGASAQEAPIAQKIFPPAALPTDCALMIKALVDHVKVSPSERGVWFVVVHNQVSPLQTVGYTRGLLRYSAGEELKGVGRHYMNKNTNPYTYIGGTHGEDGFSPVDFEPVTLGPKFTPEPTWIFRLSTLFNQVKIDGDENVLKITEIKPVHCIDDVVYGYDDTHTKTFFLISFARVDNLPSVEPSTGYSRFLVLPKSK